ncbi:hypothetical protein OUZ56_004925 [Daphnia magna]|uniref:Uncharacterized protein n=1 Tax=Daphnia magna TaxID=35525 RepID=A0ABQ9YR94_9CRUS|nr:hypothetical protein OUZ56_004925 [Daphnia magna]
MDIFKWWGHSRNLFLWHVRCLLAPWSLCNRGFSPLYAMILALLLRHFDSHSDIGLVEFSKEKLERI